VAESAFEFKMSGSDPRLLPSELSVKCYTDVKITMSNDNLIVKDIRILSVLWNISQDDSIPFSA
jgi:hypothetical protein